MGKGSWKLFSRNSYRFSSWVLHFRNIILVMDIGEMYLRENTTVDITLVQMREEKKENSGSGSRNA